jgi:hypothetical protein
VYHNNTRSFIHGGFGEDIAVVFVDGVVGEMGVLVASVVQGKRRRRNAGEALERE